ncbi:MAG: threonine/serine exporter family protein [Clostridia bacterium]|nr:threonine/serine exporter family protein [Clostridia bacterium]
MKEHFDTIMDIGEQMLLCGAEIHRVEDSIERMGLALGATDIDVFIITSSMVVTIHTPEGSFTQTRRIKNSGTDIDMLHKLNQLSRDICGKKLTFDDIKLRFAEITKAKKYPLWAEVISYVFIAGAFALFFGGKINDALVSAILGIVLRFVVLFIDKFDINKIFGKLICAFIATVLSFTAMKIGFIQSIDKVMIGNIMLLVPGVGLTNALRDLFVGDSVSGLLRLIEAVLAALAIAAGYFLFIFLSGGASL